MEWDSFFDSRVGHRYNLLNVSLHSLQWKGPGGRTIAINSAVSTGLLAVTLYLLPPTLVTRPRDAPPFLQRWRGARGGGRGTWGSWSMQGLPRWRGYRVWLVVYLERLRGRVSGGIGRCASSN